MNEGIKKREYLLWWMESFLSLKRGRVLEEIKTKPELRDYWKKLKFPKSGFKKKSLGYLDRDISKRVAGVREKPYKTW
ncbi:MAG: hypothetical protein CM1200mP12_02130 [Gammaproteobacteria bacterium]|nr:MAG: hypothetical protein CM1200mP12_02130 [Gammaproteobacteria bacterium]